MEITIDNNAGFCFGVSNSIEIAEAAALKKPGVKCLGQIVHNEEEIRRLEKLGVEFIDYEQFKSTKNETVLIRAHGEPPETYAVAKTNNIALIDTTCSIVSKLQRNIYCSWEELSEKNGQLVIFGSKDHPEVKGLNGQTGQKAMVIDDVNDIDKLDFTKPIHLFTQTTKNLSDFNNLVNKIKSRSKEGNIKINNKICAHVSNREESIINIAQTNDVVIFVAGKDSSNGKMLFEVCKRHNERSFFISSAKELNMNHFVNASRIGISGSTSTPKWLMEEVGAKIMELCA
ncbi:MAG: 4-hydroxy-3-methylbut-2-enyl diphosphate reductase [Chlorobi bacterium]|nr:4-hydroxy-3-methylbut-2-enyl diphosphate reductase [Chlorobiota bacterium]